jgi:hypothetical protein
MATAMLPHKPSPDPDRSTLPRHLWPKSDRHDISNIRRRAKAISRIIRLEVRPPSDSHKEPSHLDTPPLLMSSVNTPLPLRTVISPSLRDIDTLGLLTREDLDPTRVIPSPQQSLQDGYKGL